MLDKHLRHRIRKSINEASESARASAGEKQRIDEAKLKTQIEALHRVFDAFQLIREELMESHGIPSKCHMDEESRFVEIFIDARDPNELNAAEPVLFFLVSTEANGLGPPMLFLGDGSYGGSHRVLGHTEMLTEITSRIGSLIGGLPARSLTPAINGQTENDQAKRVINPESFDFKLFLFKCVIGYFIFLFVVLGSARFF